MTNMFNIGAKFLNDQMHAKASVSVGYLRAGFDQIDIQARIGRTESDSINNNGLVVQHKSRDFIVQVADLVIDGVLAIPLRNDLVIEDDGLGFNLIYEVVSQNDDAVYSFSDAFRNAFRIHTKLLRKEAQ